MPSGNTIVKFHVFVHSKDDNYLFRDKNDKFKFLDLMIDTFSETSSKLYTFKLLDTHYHCLIGVILPNDEIADLSAVNRKIKSVIRLLNRRYGEYFRKKYNYKGLVFEKSNEYFNRAYNDKDFKNFFRYIHLNAVKHGLEDVAEDDSFNCFNMYLAKFLQNHEVQNLSSIKEFLNDPRYLKVINAIDFNYSTRIFSDKLSSAIKFLLQHHYNQLTFHNPNAPKRLDEIGVLKLYKNSNQLQIKNSKNHMLDEFMKSLKIMDVDRKNLAQKVADFIAQFSKDERIVASNPIACLRKHYPKELRDFIKILARKVNVFSIARELKMTKYSINRMLSTQKSHHVYEDADHNPQV